MKKIFLKVGVSIVALHFCFIVNLFGQVGNDDPYGPGDGSNGQITTGCSYSAYTGNATRSITDISVAGSVGAYPLAFTRTYAAEPPQENGLARLTGQLTRNTRRTHLAVTRYHTPMGGALSLVLPQIHRAIRTGAER